MYRPKEIAETLAISPATLRLWSNNFADVLSPAAQKAQTETGTAAQRRYDDHDLAVFQRAKELLNAGATYEAALRRLKANPREAVVAAEFSAPPEEPTVEVTSVALLTEEHPIIAAFREAIEAKDQTIRSLEARIGEVAATKDQTIETLNRELLTVQATKDDLIATLQIQIEEFRSRPIPVATHPTRFRWGFLNKLFLAPVDNQAPGDTGRRAP